MKDSEMAYDQNFWERDTRSQIAAATAGVLGASTPVRIEAMMFDGTVTIPHRPDVTPEPNIPFRIARMLRGGRDFEPSAPSDWHVASVGADTAHDREGTEERVGTVIAFSRSLPAPAGYAEIAA